MWAASGGFLTQDFITTLGHNSIGFGQIETSPACFQVDMKNIQLAAFNIVKSFVALTDPAVQFAICYFPGV